MEPLWYRTRFFVNLRWKKYKRTGIGSNMRRWFIARYNIKRSGYANCIPNITLWQPISSNARFIFAWFRITSRGKCLKNIERETKIQSERCHSFKHLGKFSIQHLAYGNANQPTNQSQTSGYEKVLFIQLKWHALLTLNSNRFESRQSVTQTIFLMPFETLAVSITVFVVRIDFFFVFIHFHHRFCLFILFSFSWIVIVGAYFCPSFIHLDCDIHLHSELKSLK